jgi:hypothetical protein
MKKKKFSNNSSNPQEPKDPSVFFKLFQWIKRVIILFKRRNRRFSKEHPHLLESIQITFVYFFAVLALLYNLTALVGHIPYVFECLLPSFLQDLIKSPLVRLALAPEKTYFVYLFVIEFIIFRSLFHFSKLFKFNVLLIILLEMLQNLAISYWDILCNRQFGNVLSIDMVWALFCISLIYLFFLVCYLYSYFCAMRGKYTSLPYMDWLTDSISFWLRIRTPRMKKK